MAGSTNFQQWNPGQANQEDDAAYLADPQRSGGAPNGVAFPSETGNKLFYQVSTGLAALMQMMATKGFVVSDANLGTLASVLSAIQTSADIRGFQSLTFSPTVNCNLNSFVGFQIALNGNVTITVTGGSPGGTITLIFVQDATGGRTVTFPSNFDGAQQPDPTPNSVSVLELEITATGRFNVKTPAMSSQGYGFFRTPPTSDNTTKAATTAWVTSNILTPSGPGSGTVTLPGGFTIKWGVQAGMPDTTAVTVNFPVAFLHNCFGAFGIDMAHVGGNNRPVGTDSYSTSSFQMSAQGSGASCFWFAIGD